MSPEAQGGVKITKPLGSKKRMREIRGPTQEKGDHMVHVYWEVMKGRRDGRKEGPHAGRLRK